MIGVMFIEEFLRGPGLYAVAFSLPLEVENATRQYMVRAGAFYESLRADADIAIEKIHDHLADDVVYQFAVAGFDANPYRDVIRAAVAEVDPLPG